MKNNIFTIIILTFFVFSASAQKGKIKKGEKFFGAYSFDRAIEKLEGITDKTTSINRQLADSYFKIGDFEKSESYYATIINATDKTAEDVYQYASVLQINKKYNEADVWMKKFNQLNPTDQRGIDYKNKPGFYKRLSEDPGQFSIRNLDINTPQSDFGTAYYLNKIVFASSREGIVPVKRRWNWNGLAFLNLYQANNNANNELSEVDIFNSKLNGKFHEGPASFSKDGTFMVYTKNNYNKKDTTGVVRLHMFSMEYVDEKWQNKQEITFNSNNYSTGHGSLTADGKTMYFASDMPGGFGGSDIYVSTKQEDGTWSTPVNMGAKVNSEGNETFPNIHESEKMLFFASNGKVGLGGLDVFVAQLTNGSVGKVENLKAPINTNRDDFAFVLDANEKSGFFSSNRDGGKGDDDIYMFNLLKPFGFGKTIKGFAKDKNDQILANATISLFDESYNKIETITTSDNGAFEFKVDADKNFSLNGTKVDYFDGNNTANTKTEEAVVYVDVILEKDPGLSLYGLITDKKTGEPLKDVSVILVDNFTGKEFLNISTSASGDFRKALVGKKLNERLSYQVKLEKEDYLGKTVTFNKEITKEGEISMTEALDLGLEKIEVGLDLAEVIDIKPIYFDLGKYNIRKDAAEELDKIVKVMNENPAMEIELGSHTDSRGSDASNLRLSDKRAKASAAYIVKQGIDKARITGKGFGESTPNTVNEATNAKFPYFKLNQVLDDAYINTFKSNKNKFKEAHQLNRRTEFIIVKM